MGLVKFITVFDDEYSALLDVFVLKRYALSAYPAVFFCEKPFFDGINTDSVEFIKMKTGSDLCTDPVISAKIFRYAIKKAYDSGYMAVVIICPHSNWYPYYDSALKAARNFERSKNTDNDFFKIHVVDSKSFAAGSMFHALSMARKNVLDHCPSNLVVAHGRKNALKNITYILSDCKNSFSETEGNLKAVKVYGYKTENLELTNYERFVQYNKFAKTVAKQIMKDNRKYLISFGADCDFAGYVVGAIEKLVDKKPACSIQYSVPSASVLGVRTLCVHVV